MVQLIQSRHEGRVKDGSKIERAEGKLRVRGREGNSREYSRGRRHQRAVQHRENHQRPSRPPPKSIDFYQWTTIWATQQGIRYKVQGALHHHPFNPCLIGRRRADRVWVCNERGRGTRTRTRRRERRLKLNLDLAYTVCLHSCIKNPWCRQLIRLMKKSQVSLCDGSCYWHREKFAASLNGAYVEPFWKYSWPRTRGERTRSKMNQQNKQCKGSPLPCPNVCVWEREREREKEETIYLIGKLHASWSNLLGRRKKKKKKVTQVTGGEVNLFTCQLVTKGNRFSMQLQRDEKITPG